MSKATQQLKQYKILLIGEKCTDKFYYGSVNRISPEAPVPVFKLNNVKTYEGMSGNVKSNLQGLGADVFSIRNFEEISKSRYIDERFNQHLIRIDDDKSIEPIKIDYLPEKKCFNPDAVIISDYNKGFLPFEKVNSLLKKIREIYGNDLKIFVDSKKSDVSCYENCILKLNEREYSLAEKTIPKSSKIILTLGKEGAVYENKKYSTSKVEQFDVSGAGDTFLAALVYKFIETNSIDESIKFANKCATFVVTKSGTYSIKLEDLNDICV